MIKQMICALLSAQITFMPVVFADKPASDRAPAASAGLDYIRSRILATVSGHPNLKVYSANKKESSVESILKGTEEFYLSEGGSIFGFKTVKKNNTFSVSISAHDPKFNLIDGRSVILDSNLSAGQNMVNFESAQQSLLKALEENGAANSPAKDRAVASHAGSASGIVLTIGFVMTVFGTVAWVNTTGTPRSNAGVSAYIGLAVAFVGACLVYNN
jgi:hypothetical protein